MNLSPLPIQKFFDNNGRPLNGGLLFTYVAGTNTKLATYSDQSGTLNTNPVVLDFRGEANIWLDPALVYKFVLSPRGDTDPPTNPIWTVDNIPGFIDRQALGKILWPPSAPEIAASITIQDYGYEWYNMRRYYSGSVDADSSSEFNAALAMCASQGVRALNAPGKWTISAPILIDNIFNQGIVLEIDELVAAATWPAPASGWLSANGMIKVGTASSGAMININIRLGSIRGNSRNADGIQIGNGSYGCGISEFWCGDAQDLNIFAKIDGAIWPTATNKFSGNSLLNCNCGVYLYNDAYHCEGTIVNFSFIWHCLYGGIIARKGSQYLAVNGELDFNGDQLTQFNVSSLSTFAIGNTITGGTSNKTAELVDYYTYQGSNYLLGIEYGKTSGGPSQFINGETVTSGAASATLNSTTYTNAGGNAFYFDVILAAPTQSFHRAFIFAYYLGGIVGANLNSCEISQGNSNNAIIKQIAGIGFASGGSTLSLYDQLNNGASFLDVTSTLFAPRRDLYLGANLSRIYQQEAAASFPTGVVTTLFTEAADTSGLGKMYIVTIMNPSDRGMYAYGILVLDAFGMTYTSTASAAITVSVSGFNLQCVHGTGSTKTLRGTLLQVR